MSNQNRNIENSPRNNEARKVTPEMARRRRQRLLPAVAALAALAAGGIYVVNEAPKFIEAQAEANAFHPIDAVSTHIENNDGLDSIMDKGIAQLEKHNPDFDATSINTQNASNQFYVEYKEAFPGKPISAGIEVQTILEQNDNGEYAVVQHPVDNSK